MSLSEEEMQKMTKIFDEYVDALNGHKFFSKTDIPSKEDKKMFGPIREYLG